MVTVAGQSLADRSKEYFENNTPLTMDGLDPTGLRAALKFKYGSITAAGNTALWTPAAGKKFRLMGLIIAGTANAAWATGGIITLKLQDNTTDIGVAVPVFVPTVAGTTFGGIPGISIPLGAGYLSAAVNQPLNVNLSAAITSGAFGVTAYGTEE